MYLYFLLYKPYGVLSQFTREQPQHRVLGDVYPFPPDVYPVGRLDMDSEGLLLLTNDPRLNASLLEPERGHERTYWVQVEGIPDEKALQDLARGITISVQGKKHHTLPARIQPVENPALPERDPPIRYRETVPASWWSISLVEGKNRQVRRMWAQVGFPVLRLVRTSIENISLGTIQPGEVQAWTAEQLFAALTLPLNPAEKRTQKARKHGKKRTR